MIKEIAYKNREEWLQLRKGYIGGSDAGAVVGLNPYKGAYTLWAEKTGKTPEFEGNLITEVGSYLEDLVAKLFTRETGKVVRKKNRMIVNDQYPFACADVDRLVVGEKALLEIKTTNSFPAMKKLKNGEYPEQWYCQMLHYLAVSGLQKAYLAVLIGCRDFKVFELERDEAEIDALMDAEQRFWNFVKNNTPPPADGLQSTSETLTALYPESNSENVNLYSYQTELARYMELSEQIKDLEKAKDDAANKVKAFLGEAGRGESDRYKVSWTSSERKSFDSKRFAKENPDIDLDSYYKTSTYRTFKVTKKEGN
jgi:putative phage-type endonuclease